MNPIFNLYFYLQAISRPSIRGGETQLKMAVSLSWGLRDRTAGGRDSRYLWEIIHDTRNLQKKSSRNLHLHGVISLILNFACISKTPWDKVKNNLPKKNSYLKAVNWTNIRAHRVGRHSNSDQSVWRKFTDHLGHSVETVEVYW